MVYCTLLASRATEMKKLRRLFCFLLAAGLSAAASSASAQRAEARILPALGGVLAGAAGGGYLTVSIIVLESRMGHYIHDADDVLNWRSAPIIIGAVTGATLGAYSPRRLESAVVFGAAGLLAGGLAGWGLGGLLWQAPERQGHWAGAAIGAGFGLMAGNLYGMLYPLRGSDRSRSSDEGVPVMVRIRIR